MTANDAPTIKAVVAFQRERNIKAHVVWMDEVGFVIAHTDDERNNKPFERNNKPIGIEGCPLHAWLEQQDGMPVWQSGYYVVTPHEPDAYSEPYGADPWAFEKVE